MPSGYEELDLKVYVDYSQERQNSLNPFVFATDGTQISSASLNNCIIDPVTLSVFGTPLPMTDDWNTTFTGPYARHPIADFTFQYPGTFKQGGYISNEDYYAYAATGVTAEIRQKITLTNQVDRNKALFFSYKVLQKQSLGTGAIVSLYWEDANGTNVNTNTRLDFNTDGSCDVYRGYQLNQGSIITQTISSSVTGLQTLFTNANQYVSPGSTLYSSTGFSIGVVSSIANDLSLTLASNANIDYAGEYTTDKWQRIQRYSRTESNFSQERPISTIVNPNDVFNDIFIIPCRGKELLVLTSFGLNFSHSFGDLNVPDPPGDTTFYYNSGNKSIVPIILPTSKFSIQSQSAKLSWQLADLNFLSNWQAYSRTTFTPTAPPATVIPNSGTIQFNKNDSGVTGTGTLFNSEVSVGSLIQTIDEPSLSNSMIVGIVTSIASDTGLSLYQPNLFTSLNGTSFIARPKFLGFSAFAIGSTEVIGSGSDYLTEAEAGDYLYDNSGALIGIASTVNTDTSIYLKNPPYFSGAGVTVYKNLNPYVYSDSNLQGEVYGSVGSTYPIGDLTLSGTIKGVAGEFPCFDGETKSFIIEVSQASTGASIQDQGFMFYSYDNQYYTENLKTTNSSVDITSKLETFSMTRNENGDLSLSLSARKQLLEDLGVVKPDIISNRPIKVELQPRQINLSGQLTFDTTTVVTGVSTAFLSEVQPGESIFKADGTFAGIVTGVPSDTVLNLFQNKIPTIEYNQTCSLNPNFSPIKIFEGYLSSPNITFIQGENYDKYSVLDFTAIDKKQRLNLSYAAVAPNYDNKPLNDIILNAIYLGGEALNDPNKETIVIDDSILTYQIPINRNNSQGQYNFVLNLGDTAGGFIEQIRNDYAQNFTFYARGDWQFQQIDQSGFDNFTQFKFKDIDLISPDAKKLDLYLNDVEADSVGNIPVMQSYKRTIRSLRKVYEAPEANRIMIVGLDKTNGNRIEKIIDNISSQNPSTPPNQRADNWLGDVYPFVFINERLNTATDVNQAATQFYNRIATGREIIEFDSDLLTYFDGTTRATADNEGTLVGSVSVTENSNVVNGGGTLFQDELVVGDIIYSSINGDYIGIVAEIVSQTELNLLFDATITFTGGYNKSTYYVDQYNYIDIGDVVRVYYLDLTYDDFQIIDWSCASNREKLNPSEYDINVRTATYRAKKVTVPVATTPFISFVFNNIPSVNQIIVTQGTALPLQLFAVDTPYEELGFSWSLSNQPAGMTINASTGVISWTPSGGQANQIFEDIVATIQNESANSAEYSFSVRVYDTT